MFKKLTKILILTLAFLLMFTTSVNMPLGELDIAFAGGDDSDHREEQKTLYTYQSEINDWDKMGDSSLIVDADGMAGDSLYAMLFETGRQRGEIVEFFVVKYKDPRTGTSRMRRLDPSYTFDGTGNKIGDSTYNYYVGQCSAAVANQVYYETLAAAAKNGISFSPTIYQPLYDQYTYFAGAYKSQAEQASKIVKNLERARTAAKKYANLIMGSVKGVDVQRSQDAADSVTAGRGIISGDFNYGNLPALYAANTVSTLFFSMNKDEMANLEGIYMYVTQNGRLENWDVTKWQIYRVDKEKPIELEMYSDVTSASFVNFTGWKEYEVVNIQDGIQIDSQFIEQKTFSDCNMIYIPVSGENKQTGSDSTVLKETVVTEPDSSIYPRLIKYKNSPSVKYSSDSKDCFTVVMNIPDNYASGINHLNKQATQARFSPEEQLYAFFEYLASDGQYRTVEVPVITNSIIKAIRNEDAVAAASKDVTDAVKQENAQREISANKKKFDNGQILSYAQQNENIVFNVRLPNCTNIESVKFRYDLLDGDVYDDALEVNAIKVYRSQDVSVSYSYNYFLQSTPNPTAIPAYSYDASYWRGNQIACGDETFFFLNKGGNNNYLQPEEPEVTRYLVVLNTFSDVRGVSGTKDPIIMALKYTSVTGEKNCLTKEYVLTESADEYYGYWMGQDLSGNVIPAAYQYGMRSGGEFCFVIQTTDISEITGFTARLDDESTDDWQLDGIQVYRLDSLNPRIGLSQQEANYNYSRGTAPFSEAGLLASQKTAAANGITVDRTYYREFTGDILCSYKDLYALVQPNIAVDFDFNGQKKQEEKTRDYSEYYYEMDWTTANGNLNFMEEAKLYTVNVTIPTNRSQGVVDDGCGSKNLFYFQLVFKRGSSGYVLANTQMTTDGFVPGATSSFTVATNEDLGDVVSVNIIADDLDENSDILDKLCIDNIEIIKNNPNGVCKRFVCEINSWIDREYHSNDENQMKAKVIGRPYTELVTTFPVDYSAYMLKYQFTITSAEGTTAGKDSTIQSQYVGPLTSQIEYYNSKKELKRVDVDVVRAIYEYNNKSPKQENGVYVSDPETMFIPGHTDRFFVSLSDCIEFKSIRLFANYPEGNTDWCISDFSISIITSDAAVSRLAMNELGEYEMRFDPDDIQFLVSEITNQNMNPYYKWQIRADVKNGKLFEFAKNEIPVIEHDETVIPTVSRIPESANDTFNMFVYMSKEASDPNVYKHKLTAEVTYAGEAYDYTNSAVLSFQNINGRIVGYTSGMQANNFKALRSVQISSSVLKDANKPNYNCMIDYVIVQQMRGNVVVNTYIVTFLGADASQQSAGVGSAMITKAESLGDYQEVTLVLGEGTETTTLSPMTHDVAIRLNYTSENEPKPNSTGSVFQSPYIYITDQHTVEAPSGNVEPTYPTIKAGDTIKLRFEAPYLKAVNSVGIIATDGIAFDVEAIYIDEYQKLTATATDATLISTEVCTNCGDVGVAGSTFDVNKKAGKVTRANFTFHTAQASDGNTGTSNPVKLEITYKKKSGETAKKIINDLLKYSENEKFITNATDSMSFILYDVDEIRNIRITPTDSWKCDNIKLEYNKFVEEDGVVKNVTEERELAIANTIYNETPYTANFCNISVSANAIIGSTNKTVVDGTLEKILIKPEDTVKVKIKVNGSLEGEGYTVLVEKVVNGAGSYVNQTTEGANSGTYEFTAPKLPDGVTSEDYRITVTSNENTKKSAIVQLTVSN